MISSRVGMGKLQRMMSPGQPRRRTSVLPIGLADATGGTSLSTDFCAEGLHLRYDKAFHTLNRVFLFKTEIESLNGCGTY